MLSLTQHWEVRKGCGAEDTGLGARRCAAILPERLGEQGALSVLEKQEVSRVQERGNADGGHRDNQNLSCGGRSPGTSDPPRQFPYPHFSPVQETGRNSPAIIPRPMKNVSVPGPGSTPNKRLPTAMMSPPTK